MSLQNLQAEFLESIFSETAAADLIAPFENLQIYRHNIQATLSKAIRTIYPLCRQLLGDDYFSQITLDYLVSYPSCTGNLHEYGEYFADFLKEQSALDELVYLYEVAKFEWICHCLQSAADHNPLNLDSLAKIPPEEYDVLHFELHPAAQLHRFKYPILQIIDLCKGLIDDIEDVHTGGVNLLIMRRDDAENNLSLIALSEADYIFLEYLHEGHALATALAHASMIELDFNLEQKLPAWIQAKILVDCYVVP